MRETLENEGILECSKIFMDISAKLIHTALTVFVIVILLWKNPEFAHAVNTKEWTNISLLIFSSIHMVAFLFFVIASSANPGFVTKSSVENFIQEVGRSQQTLLVPIYTSDSDCSSYEDNEQDLEALERQRLHRSPASILIPKLVYKEKEITFRRCNYCHLQQPLRAKHCDECRRCVRKFDHHCPYLGNCVGELNHRYFLLFLASELVVILLSAHFTLNSFSYSSKFLDLDWFKNNAFQVIIFIIESLGGLVVSVLLFAHLYLMGTNQTTWEFMARHKITYLRELSEDDNPFDEGVCLNSLHFLFQCSLQNWECQFLCENSEISGSHTRSQDLASDEDSAQGDKDISLMSSTV